MSLSKSIKNFYRVGTLIIDHAADAMRCLLHHFIQKTYQRSFKDFVIKHQHEIYHKFNMATCCQCTKFYRRPYTQVLRRYQIEILFDNSGPKLSCHNHSSQSELCCSKVKDDLQLNDLDITLLRFFLVTYFEDEFWQNCLTGVSFHDFLNQNKHDIFHLVQPNTQCCLCIKKLENTAGILTIANKQWDAMFATADPQYVHAKLCVDAKGPCSVSATKGIHPSSLNSRERMILLSKFCIMMKHIDTIVNAKNRTIAHTVKGELSDDQFGKLWNEVETSIMYLSNITSTHLGRSESILELREKPLEETTCLEIRCLPERQKHVKEHLIQECRKLDQSFNPIDENVTVGIQEDQSTEVEIGRYKKKVGRIFKVARCICILSVVVAASCIIIIGSVYRHDCPAEIYIPMFLIVTGSIVIAAIVMAARQEKDTKNKHITNIKLCLMLAWFIAGNVWVFGILNHFTADPSKMNYCHPMLSVSAIMLIINTYYCIAISLVVYAIGYITGYIWVCKSIGDFLTADPKRMNLCHRIVYMFNIGTFIAIALALISIVAKVYFTFCHPQ